MATWFLLLLIVPFITGALAGYLHVVQLAQLNRKRVFGGLLILLIILTVMTGASWLRLFSQSLAIKVTMIFYLLAAGFFIGYGVQLILLRRKAGAIEYMYRSPWIDLAPNLIAAALFVFGIYRTGILTGGLFTGIGITSGISLIGFGFLGWTLHIVPEFRSKGILLLDQYIEWKRLITFDWIAENTLRVEYFTGEKQITEFKTYITDEDQSTIEHILRHKMDEYEERRKEMMK